MGTRNSRPVVEPRIIKQKIKSTTKEYLVIKQEFGALCVNGKISKDDFINKYLRKKLKRFSQQLLERLFTVLSYNGKDHIVFQEFVQTKYLLEHLIPEEQVQIAKSADDFFTEEDIIYNHRLRLIFNIFDLDFDGYISRKEFQKIIPILMQDVSQRQFDDDEMKEFEETYNEWFHEISKFALIQFDRTKMGRISWRDFRNLARHDLTIQNIMEYITPKQEEYQCFRYANLVTNKIQKQNAKRMEKLKKKKLKNDITAQ